MNLKFFDKIKGIQTFKVELLKIWERFSEDLFLLSLEPLYFDKFIKLENKSVFSKVRV